MQRTRLAPLLATALATVAAGLLATACQREAPEETEVRITAVPEPAAPRDVAVLEVAGFGEIRIELLADVAPKTAAHFASLAEEGFYDGTTFHRVVKGFMIQGGCPNTRDRDPRNDGLGGNDRQVVDERTDIPQTPGIVSLANRGFPDSNGSQWFIMVGERPDLTGRYSIFGRVVEGMDVALAISEVETDLYGRYGPKNRPRENVVLERVRIERAGGAAEAPAEAGGAAESGEEAGGDGEEEAAAAP